VKVWGKMGDGVIWAALGVAFVACYLPTLEWLHWKYEAHESYFSHGYLVPFISGYLIFRKRHALAGAMRRGHLWGLPVIAGSLLLHLLGVVGNINFVSGFSMVLYLLGCVVFFWGTEVARKIAFPLFFLFFLCPVPNAYIDVVAIPMKSLSTDIALAIMRVMGVPYYREGFLVSFAGFQFVVGTPCNGMRSLISLLAVGLLFLHLFRPRKILVTLVFLACIPLLAVGLNGLRIAVLFLIALHLGPEAASPEHYLHETSGLVVFILGMACLMLIGRRFHGRE